MKKQFAIRDGAYEISFIFNNGEFYLEFEDDENIIRLDTSDMDQLGLLRFLIAGE